MLGITAQDLVPIDAYWHALGKFVSAFARVENLVQTALWQLSGVNPPTAQAVFSGVRVDAALGLFSRIADAQNWEQKRKDDLKYVIEQFGIISRVRNDILHYSVSPIRPGEFEINTRIAAHVQQRIRITAISPEIFEKMNNDLAKIEHHLIALAWPEQMQMPYRHADYDKVLAASWQYIPPSPARERSAERRNRRSHRPDTTQPQ